MNLLSERMFSIAGNLHLSSYKDTKYEPLELITEAQEEVSIGNSVARTLKRVRTSKGDYWFKQWFSSNRSFSNWNFS